MLAGGWHSVSSDDVNRTPIGLPSPGEAVDAIRLGADKQHL